MLIMAVNMQTPPRPQEMIGKLCIAHGHRDVMRLCHDGLHAACAIVLNHGVRVGSSELPRYIRQI